MRFRFKKTGLKEPQLGPHTVKGVVYHPGDIIETDSDLAKNFPLKFERIDKPLRKAKAIREDAAPRPAPVPLPFGDLGENVTNKCDGVPAGFAVFNDRVIKYAVVDVANNLIAKLGLRNLNEVNAYLASLRPQTAAPTGVDADVVVVVEDEDEDEDEDEVETVGDDDASVET